MNLWNGIVKNLRKVGHMMRGRSRDSSPHFFHRKACQITKIEILELHEKIGHENGLYQANRLA
jgi:hypothetical protein